MCELEPYHCTCSGCCTLLRPKEDAPLPYKLFVFLLNVMLTPLELVFHAFTVYVFPCMSAWTKRLVFAMCGCWAEPCAYTDHHFPHNSYSLGPLETDTSAVTWVRLKDLCEKDSEGKPQTPVLFDATIDAGDVCQGALGDCWLLAAFATLCERKAYIQNCFLTSAYNPFGRYSLRLYDQQKGCFFTVTVDDWIPCRHGKPLFTQFNGREMWPLLLEKAYAKSKGSYHAIEGGRPLEAMKDLTGYGGRSFLLRADGSKAEKKQSDEAFKKLKQAFEAGCLLAAGSRGEDNTRKAGRGSLAAGIVPGHAYSILDIRSPHLTLQNIHLLKIRNPWGQHEWEGDWCDGSPLWDKHKGVAFEIGKPGVKEDGVFYMSWEDFHQTFNVVDVLYPHFGLDSVHLRVVETDPYCGTCRGLAWGCAKYWFLCKGLRTLWWDKDSAKLQRDLEAESKGWLSV